MQDQFPDKGLSKEQGAMIMLQSNNAAELIDQMFDIFTPEALNELTEDLKDATLENLEIYSKILRMLQIEDPLEEYTMETPIDSARRGTVSNIRQYFLRPKEVEDRIYYTEEDISRIQSMLNSNDFRKDSGARDYSKMIKALDPEGRRGFTSLALAEKIRKLIKTGEIVEKNKYVNQVYTEEDIPLIESMLNDSQFRKEENNARDYLKMIERLDPDGNRKLTLYGLRKKIRELINNKIIEENIKYAPLGNSYGGMGLLRDLDKISEMLSSKSFRQSVNNARDYNAMIKELDPDGTRGITRSILETFIDRYKKEGKIIENEVLNPGRVSVYEQFFDQIEQMLKNPELRTGAGGRNYEAMIKILDPTKEFGLTPTGLEKYIRRKISRREMDPGIVYDPSNVLNK